MAHSRLCIVEGCGKCARSRGWCNMHYSRWVRNGDPEAGGYGKPLEWLRENYCGDGDECRPWPFGRTRWGYGKVRVEGCDRNAHRLSCEWAHGPPPSEKHQAAHWCGNPACINAKHLRWATSAENCADKVAHGTTNRGERQGSSKLSKGDVLSIRMRAGRGETMESIAADLRVSPSAISKIVRQVNWGWLN